MIPPKATFELCEGWLCVREVDTFYNDPVRTVRFWPICRAMQTEYSDVVGTVAHRSNNGDPGVYYAMVAYDTHPMLFRLLQGGQTKPIKTEQTPFPCPKSGGKKTRYYNGHWQKYLKTAGWVNLT